jgi:hypothetical protein
VLHVLISKPKRSQIVFGAFITIEGRTFSGLTADQAAYHLLETGKLGTLASLTNLHTLKTTVQEQKSPGNLPVLPVRRTGYLATYL